MRIENLNKAKRFKIQKIQTNKFKIHTNFIIEESSQKKFKIQIDSFNIQNLKDLQDIKFILTKNNCKSGVPFNSNVLRVALNQKEEYIASLILEKKYQTAIDEKIILKAIKSD